MNDLEKAQLQAALWQSRAQTLSQLLHEAMNRLEDTHTRHSKASVAGWLDEVFSPEKPPFGWIERTYNLPVSKWVTPEVLLKIEDCISEIDISYPS